METSHARLPKLTSIACFLLPKEIHSPVTTSSEAQNCSYLAKFNMLNCLQTRSRMPYRFLHIRGNWFTTSSKQHYLLPLFPKETHLTQARSIFYSNSTAFIPEATRIYYSHLLQQISELPCKKNKEYLILTHANTNSLN